MCTPDPGSEYASEAALHTGTRPYTNADNRDPKGPVEIKCPQIALRDVVRSVVSQVSELHKCSVCTRDTTTRQLVLETPQQHCPNLDQSRSHLPCCEHSWAEWTTGPRTMQLQASMRVSDHIGTCEARNRASDQEERTYARAGPHSYQIHSPRSHRDICETKALIAQFFHAAPIQPDRTFEASCRALHPVIDRTQSPQTECSKLRAVPCIH